MGGVGMGNDGECGEWGHILIIALNLFVGEWCWGMGSHLDYCT